MIDIKFDVRDFEHYAWAIGAAQDQVPFALALALNKAADDTRTLLVQEWPSHVKVRNQGFIRYALRREFATKHNLRVAIYDQTGKPFTRRLDSGGTHAARGSNLAIPVEANVKVGAHGVRRAQLPRNLTGNVFVASRNGRGAAIWKRVGKGKNARLKLMYVLKPSVPVPSKMPFHDHFEIAMREGVRTSFPAAMARAMKSRRS